MTQNDQELESRLDTREGVLLLLAAVVLFLFYTVIFSASSNNADSVNGYLVGLNMGAGNWRLAHWYLPVDSYWFQDALAYALITRLFGNRPFLLVIVPALAWTGVVVVSWLLARRHRPHRELLWASLVVAAILALPLLRDNPITVFITLSSDHVVTILEGLVILLLFDRFRQHGGIATLGGGLLLSIAAVAGDPLTVFMTAIPIAGASLLCNDTTPGRRAAILASAVVAIVLGFQLVALNTAHGGFHIVNDLSMRFSSIEQIGRNASFTLQGILGFWGANFFNLSIIAALPHLLRLPLLGLTIWFSAIACCRVYESLLQLRTSVFGFLDCVLLLGATIVIAACVLSAMMVNVWTGRYLLPVVVYLVILTAREVPPSKTRDVIGVVALASSVLAANGYQLTLHPALRLPAGTSELARWLEQNHLRFGYAQYWTASPVTVASRGKVQALALIANRDRLVPFLRNARDNWYPSPLNASLPFFVIIDPPGTTPETFPRADAEAVFGAPSETVKVDGFVVEIYR